MVRDLDQVTEYLGVWRSKDEIREALGRSPAKGDAVAMPFADDIPPTHPRSQEIELVGSLCPCRAPTTRFGASRINHDKGRTARGLGKRKGGNLQRQKSEVVQEIHGLHLPRMDPSDQRADKSA